MLNLEIGAQTEQKIGKAVQNLNLGCRASSPSNLRWGVTCWYPRRKAPWRIKAQLDKFWMNKQLKVTLKPSWLVLETDQGNRTLRARDRAALRHFGTVQVGRKCPDISAPVPKCPKDTSDLSTELSSPMVQTVPPYGPKCPTLWSEVSHPNFVVYVARRLDVSFSALTLLVGR